MKEKDFNKRAWLNPTGDATMQTRADSWDASFSIRDCNRSVTIHAGDSLEFAKNRKAFIRKLDLVIKMLRDLQDEVNRRWQ